MSEPPRYPVYIPSKGRADVCYTAQALEKWGTPYHLVVEPQEEAAYRARFPGASILVLPWDNPGSVIPARNWIKAHSISRGAGRHWQIDDNIREFKRRWKGKRIPCDSSIALRVAEDFTDRYTNIAVSGMNYEMFLPNGETPPPFLLNVRVYSCSLVNNAIPHMWRGRYNEDTDLCLQVLADGWCTVLFNAVLVHKIRTMAVKGGNTQTLYQGDGRLRMAKSLERMWPGVVETRRRFQRPQHVVKDAWKKFDQPLVRRDDLDWDALKSQGPDEYGMTPVQVKPVQSPAFRKLLGLPEDG